MNSDHDGQTLQGFQKRYLRALGNTLDPTVMIGRAGVTESVLGKLDSELTAHELVKVRFLEYKDEKKSLAAALCEETGSQLAGMVGHTVLLYRPHPEPDRRTIRLPRR